MKHPAHGCGWETDGPAEMRRREDARRDGLEYATCPNCLGGQCASVPRKNCGFNHTFPVWCNPHIPKAT
jgi:hypothetical protein